MMRALVVASLLIMTMGADGSCGGSSNDQEWSCSAICKDDQNADILTFEPRPWIASSEADAVALCVREANMDTTWCPPNAPTPTDRCNCHVKSDN